MKLCIYQTDLKHILRNCLDSLAASGYKVESDGFDRGHIQAVKEGDFPLHYSLIDLKVLRDKYGVTVSVISSNLSKLFGNFCHNRKDEETFVEHFLDRLRQDSERNFELAFGEEELA